MADFPETGLEAGREALRRFLAGDDDLSSMLTKIMLLATETVPGADLASITMVGDGGPMTPVFTDNAALELDQIQYRLGDGPCLAALRHQGVECVVSDSQERWPTYAAAAVERGVKETLSAPLTDDEVSKGSLNLYTRSGFDDSSGDLACRFADQLGIAAVNVTLYVQGSALADNLLEAMEHRAVIEQAKGILMRAESCDAETAFGLLRAASQHQNRKLREIAHEVVERYED